ncbi:MAG: M28 family peptidase [Phycisphaerales bacterium]
MTALRRSTAAAFVFALVGVGVGPVSIAFGEVVDLDDPPIARDAARAVNDSLPNIDEWTRNYMEHVVVLSSRFFEGRKPGTRGDALAREYAAWHFQRLGLLPAFEGVPGADGRDGSGWRAGAGGGAGWSENASFFQGFEVGGTTSLVSSSAVWSVNRDATELALDESYSPLGFSGSGEASGPIVFVGYAIEDGPEGYTSFDPEVDLTGKIVLAFRFEPMDTAGRSLWGNNGRWSNYASMGPKMEAIAERGAAGIILVQPPGADDPRAQRLESVSSTNYGFELDIPVVMLDLKAAKDLVEASAPDGMSLLDLRRKADEGEVRSLPLGARPVRFSMDVELKTVRTPTMNVGAILPGRGDLADEYVVIGGHIDHLGYGGSGSRYRGSEELLHAGADDNASGTAGVLLAAEALAQQYSALGPDADARSIVFLLFNAEEMGLLGARHFVENTPLNASNTTAMLNLDMIGRLAQNGLEINGTGTATEWDAVLDPVIERMGFETTKRPGGVGPSDHAWFYRSDIPVLHWFSGLHDDYHHPRDTWDKIHFGEGARLSLGVAEIAMDLAQRPDRLTFVSNTDNARRGERPQLARMTVRMGITPGNYEEGATGLEVAGVAPGGSADLAGLEAGDVIMLWNGEELAGVTGLMTRLGEAKPGDVVDLSVDRNGERIQLRMTLQAREATEG